MRRRGYTLLELLTSIAALVILLGLMVSLARRVRAQSAEAITKGLLVKLDRLVAEYQTRNRRLPDVTPFILDTEHHPDELVLQQRAVENNRQLLRALRTQVDLDGGELANLPEDIYNGVNLRDAWGDPIVFLPHYHPDIGTPPGGRYFFVSAGPDGRYLTRADNLYSYENPALEPDTDSPRDEADMPGK